MRGPGRPLLLGLLLVLGAAGPGVAEPREAADRQTLLRLIVEILQELRKYHSGESKRLHLLGQHDYTLGRREVSDYPAYPEEQRVEIVPRDLRMKDKFLKHLTGPLYFSPKCSKHFHRLYHNTRDCTIPALSRAAKDQQPMNHEKCLGNQQGTEPATFANTSPCEQEIYFCRRTLPKTL
ncbi:ALK and LTK ligand 2 isoform X2 [Mirounga angustirostris]|uniref:ALK and LTK ligand 2 isoform X2 n=1 Tax=Mirounga angustirostris TaxID=9716 RepID=UPI00313F3082